MSFSGFKGGPQQQLPAEYTRFRRYSTVVNQNIDGITPGWPIACVGIDNPTGSWLSIRPFDIFVAPYTLGFQTNLVPATNSLSIDFLQFGPNNAVSSSSGVNPVNIIVYDRELGNEPGNAFIPVIPELTNVNVSINADFTNGTSFETVIAGTVPPTGQRIRLFRCSAALTSNAATNNTSESNVYVAVAEHTTGITIVTFSLSVGATFASAEFGQGLDLTLNNQLSTKTSIPWGAGRYDFSATFQFV